MASITLAVSEDVKAEIHSFPWVNWSELAREDFIKKVIFENYMKTKKISDEEWKFCESIDWHPVDELPLKKSFIKELEKARKEKPIKVNSVEEIFTRFKD